MMVNLILQSTVSRLNAKARTASGFAALRSKVNVDNIINREDQLKRDLQHLEEIGSWEGREAIRAELNELEWKHTEAGLGLFINAGDAQFASPVKVVGEASVEKGGATYGFSILLAVVLGGMAGVAGLVTRRMVLTLKAAKPRTRDGAQVSIIGIPCHCAMSSHAAADSTSSCCLHNAGMSNAGPRPIDRQFVMDASAL